MARTCPAGPADAAWQRAERDSKKGNRRLGPQGASIDRTDGRIADPLAPIFREAVQGRLALGRTMSAGASRPPVELRHLNFGVGRGFLQDAFRGVRRLAPFLPSELKTVTGDGDNRGRRAALTAIRTFARVTHTRSQSMGKTILWTSIVLCIAASGPSRAADNELTPAEKAAGWQLLFNGHDH